MRNSHDLIWELLLKKNHAFLAISFELLGNVDAALQSYEGVNSILIENPVVKNKSFIEWSEEALYRATLLGLNSGQVVVHYSI